MIIDKIRMFEQNLNDNKKDWLYLGIPILISLLIKLILLGVLYNSPVNNDGITYINAARQYLNGNFADAMIIYPMPTYPLLLVLVNFVIHDWILTGYFISIVSMVLATIPLYYLTKTMFGRKAAFWACLVFAILPRMNEWSMYISRDPLFLFLFTMCIYFALEYIIKRNSFIFGATFVLAWTATLIRIEGVVFIGFYFCVLIYLAFADKDHRSNYFSRALIWAGIPFGIAVLAFVSSGVRSIAVSRFDHVYLELVDFIRGGFLSRPSEIYQFFSEAIANPPFFNGHYSFAALCKHYLPLIYMMGILQIIMKILLPSTFIPLYFGVKGEVQYFGSKYSGKFVFAVWFLFVALSYYFLIKNDFLATRYLMIPAFLLLPWIGVGLNRLYTKASHSLHNKAILFLILIIVLAPAVKTFRLISSGDSTTAQTVQWLKDNDKINKTQIVSNDYKLAFYIDLEAEGTSEWKTHSFGRFKTPLDINKIEEFALKKDAHIVVIKVKTKDRDKVGNPLFYQEINSYIGDRFTIIIYKKTANK